MRRRQESVKVIWRSRKRRKKRTSDWLLVGYLVSSEEEEQSSNSFSKLFLTKRRNVDVYLEMT